VQYRLKAYSHKVEIAEANPHPLPVDCRTRCIDPTSTCITFAPSVIMGDMSDLDLVAKAMAPTNQPDKVDSPSAPSSTTKVDPKPKTGSKTTDPEPEPIDLSSLTPEDMAMLKPLLNAMNLKDSDDLDDAALHDLIAQMDSAAGVADDLEGKLDRLIGDLGSFEKEVVDGMDQKAGGKGDEKDVKGTEEQ
jgi:hypothetical protein